MRRDAVFPSGALLIDKPSGMTSFDVIRRLKHAFGIKKIGHSGTLDPLATGLLIILVGEATRLQSILLEAKKAYEGIFLLGVKTTTDDIEGEVMSRDERRDFLSRDKRELCRELEAKFKGRILQRPPEFSAVKKDGKKSYELARQGKLIELEPREVEVYSLELELLDPERLRYHVECSKGTYVRSLGRDMGEFLGSFACVETLRRTSSSGFSVNEAVPLQDLLSLDAAELPVVPMERLLAGLPRVVLPDSSVSELLLGRKGVLLGLSREEEGLHALYSESGRFSGLLEPESGTNGLKIRFLRPISEG